MLGEIKARLNQGFRTIPFPREEPALPAGYQGVPAIDGERCRDGCRRCADACPTNAIEIPSPQRPRLDLGSCLFCSACVEACPEGAIRFTRDYRMACRAREDLRMESGKTLQLAKELDAAMLRVFGRSLKLRQVSAGGCNGCEAEVNVLNTVVFDLSRFGIQFVASPRHADGLLITGPVTQNMKPALLKAYEAIPEPKFVIAVGACAISGGPFAGHPEIHGGAGGVVPVDLHIPGCPPHPVTTLDGLLRLLNHRIP